MKLKDFLADEYVPLRLRRATITITKYRHTLEQWGRHLGRQPTLDDLTDRSVSLYLGHVAGRAAPATVNTQRKHILALWRLACQLGLVAKWPTVPKDTEPRRVPRAMTLEEMQTLLDATGRLTGRIGRCPEPDWWRSLLLACWDTGERIGAMLQVEWSDLDLRRLQLLVPAERRKGGLEDRLYRLHPDTVESLRRRAERTGRVWPWPFAPTYLWQRLKRLQELAGLPTGRQHGFHAIRRSVASYAALAGSDATALLGHSSPQVTRVYIDPRIVRTQQAIDVVPRPERERKVDG